MNKEKQRVIDNSLAGETSPYLLQHADNPVHWQPWNESSLALAKALKKPILLSIGYSACHWCHVMAHESFEDTEVAAVMNAHFINIKVDREERPDIDQIYMAALHALGEQGGWPLTMFLDSDGRPFWGGTYFPKIPKYGRPGFIEVLQAVNRTWQHEPDRIQYNTKALTEHLEKLSETGRQTSGVATAGEIDTFAGRVLALIDEENGGIGSAPKFPNAPMMEAIWRSWTRNGDTSARQAFLKGMTALCQGGIYDHLGGGLARYATDARWLVPHFEKMLYDNAHFIRHLAWAHTATKEDLFRIRIEETVQWIRREMLVEDAAFASSLDADSDGEEGKYYVWQAAEIAEILGDRAPDFNEAYGVTETGNWEGTNILNRRHAGGFAAESFSGERESLLQNRSGRIPPGRDDKVLIDWNGAMIRSLAEAGDLLEREEWVNMAATAYRFICESISGEGGVPHSWRYGSALYPPILSDLANMGLAAFELFRITLEKSYLDDAMNFAWEITGSYSDGNGGYYLTAKSAADLIVRPQSHTDDASPSPSSQVLELFSRLSLITGGKDWADHAENLAASLSASTRTGNHGIAGNLNALDTYGGLTSLVVIGAETGDWKAVAGKSADLRRIDIFAGSTSDLPEGHPVRAAPTLDQTAAYLCRNQTCSLPITDSSELAARLEENRVTGA